MSKDNNENPALPPRKHPAYGVITSVRTSHSKGQHLFGSPIRHSNTVAFLIQEGEYAHGIQDSSHFGNKEIIEVEMSQQHFGELLTSMGLGRGTPCTITRRDGKIIPPIEGFNPVDVHTEEFKIAIAKVSEPLTELVEEIRATLDKPSVTKKERAELLKLATSIEMQLQSNLPYLARQCFEYMHKAGNAAKQEFNAHVEQTIKTVGVAGASEAFRADPEPRLPELPEPDESNGP